MPHRISSDERLNESRMSFGAHLEELRVVLMRCLVGVALGCVVGFYFAPAVVSYLKTPLDRALDQFHYGEAKRDYLDRFGYFPPEADVQMRREGMVPETIFIDLGQFVAALRSLDPNALSEIDLTPYRILPAHLEEKNVAEVCAQLSQPAMAPIALQPMVEQLAEMFSADQLVIAQQIADGKAAREFESSVAQRIWLLAQLNRLLDRPELHNSPAFAAWFEAPGWSWDGVFGTTDEDNQLRMMKEKVDVTEDAELSRRLNRWLVVNAFQGLLVPPQMELIAIEAWNNAAVGTQSLSPHEGFMTWLKAGLISGLVLSAPWIFYQLWVFVAAGLYPAEQKYVHIYLPMSLILFASGVGLAFFFVFEPVLAFLFSFNASMGISPQVRIGEWLNFVMFLPLGFGVAFQLPLVMLFLNRIAIFTAEVYLSKWRIAVMVIAVLSMLLTPADPISMVMLAGPLTVLYFFGIGLCHWLPQKRDPYAERDRNDQPSD